MAVLMLVGAVDLGCPCLLLQDMILFVLHAGRFAEWTGLIVELALFSGFLGYVPPTAAGLVRLYHDLLCDWALEVGWNARDKLVVLQ